MEKKAMAVPNMQALRESIADNNSFSLELMENSPLMRFIQETHQEPREDPKWMALEIGKRDYVNKKIERTGKPQTAPVELGKIIKVPFYDE